MIAGKLIYTHSHTYICIHINIYIYITARIHAYIYIYDIANIIKDDLLGFIGYNSTLKQFVMFPFSCFFEDVSV